MLDRKLLISAVTIWTSLIFSHSLSAGNLENWGITNNFSAQGFVFDGDDLPLADGTYSLTYSTYYDTLGLPVYTETLPVEVRYGRFTAILKGLNGIGPFPRPFFPDSMFFPARYLRMSIEDDIILPAIRLLSAPTAVMTGRIRGDVLTDTGIVLVANMNEAAPGAVRVAGEEDSCSVGLYSPGQAAPSILMSNPYAGAPSFRMGWSDADSSMVLALTPAGMVFQKWTGFMFGWDTTLAFSGHKLSCSDTIESSSGGFQFPDGTVQTTAGAPSGGAQATVSGVIPPGLNSRYIHTSSTNLTQAGITVPSPGYVLAVATCETGMYHTNLASSAVNFGLSLLSGSLPTDQDKRWSIPPSLPTGEYYNVLTASKLFPVGAGDTTIYLVGQRISGADSAWAVDISLSLVFIPEAFGTVSPVAILESSEGEEMPETSLQSPSNRNPGSSEAPGINEMISSRVERLSRDNERLRQEVADLRDLVQQFLKEEKAGLR